VFLLFCLVISVGYLGASQAALNAPSNSSILGSLEVRPSYKSIVGEFHSEDSAVLGYQFNKNNSLVYKQEFNTNLYDPSLPESKSGINAYLFEGYLKAKANNVYQNGDLSLSYEGRQYFPTWSVKRDAGMLTALRNYAKVKYQLTSAVALTAEEVPVIHLYNQAGSMGAKGPNANPFFENRASIGLDYAFSDKLKLSIPLLVSSVRTRAYDNLAANNDKWGHKVWVNPEIYYSVNSNVVVGMGYYSDNLVRSNFSDTAIGDGLNQGTTQFIFSTNL
jgi:hypothetical protein